MRNHLQANRIKLALALAGLIILIGIAAFLARNLVSGPGEVARSPSVIAGETPTETPSSIAGMPSNPPPPATTGPSPATLTSSPPAQFIVNPGDSIQAVLDRMPPGTICGIKPGIYRESLVIPKSGLTLRKEGAGEVILDAEGDENAVLIKDISDTRLQGLTVRNAAASLIKITGSLATRNTVRQCTLLNWGLDGTTTYAGAVDSADGASYTTVDLCYLDRGNCEALWTQNPEAISFHFSGGYHTITNNIIWGVCRDRDGKPVTVKSDFGDGYPLYKFNILDGICGEDGKDRLDFDGTLISGNHIYGAHDDMVGVQGLGRNCTISSNYIDAMGGAACIVLRGASIGPVYVSDNICVNSGINCFKYASWSQGMGTAIKYISRNVYYSTLTRGYTQTLNTWYIPIIDRAYSRFIDGEVNEADYDNLLVENNYVLCRAYFLCLMPGSGTNNTFSNNHFSTLNDQSCVKWFSDKDSISFQAFNNNTSGNNVWETISRPSEPGLPAAGAG